MNVVADLLGMLACIFLMGVAATWGLCWIARPRGNKQHAPAPARVMPAPPPRPAPAAAGTYVRRWTLQRRAWEIAERHRWQAEFDR